MQPTSPGHCPAWCVDDLCKDPIASRPYRVPKHNSRAYVGRFFAFGHGFRFDTPRHLVNTSNLAPLYFRSTDDFIGKNNHITETGASQWDHPRSVASRQDCFISGCLLSWGKLRQEPATRWFDWSFAPMPRCNDRFARQNRCGLPPEISPGFSLSRHSSPSFGSDPRY